MTPRLINPVETAQKAIKAGILTPARKHWPNEEFDYAPKVRLPSEVGLQAIRPTPQPSPCKLLKRAKREAGNRKKWVILPKDRPELFK